MCLNLICFIPIIVYVIALIVNILLNRVNPIMGFDSFILSMMIVEVIVIITLWRNKKCIKEGISTRVTTTLVVYVGLNIIASTVFPISESIREQSLSNIYYALFIAPVLEEVIFRGICIDRLNDNMLNESKCILSGILFAIAHLNFQQGLIALVMGYIFAKVRIERGLLFAVMLHIMCNICALLLNINLNIYLKLFFVLFTVSYIFKNITKFHKKNFKEIVCVGLVFSIIIYLIISTLLII